MGLVGRYVDDVSRFMRWLTGKEENRRGIKELEFSWRGWLCRGGIRIDKIPPCKGEGEYDIIRTVFRNGEVAQLVEHHVRNVGVGSSNLLFSTIHQGK